MNVQRTRMGQGLSAAGAAALVVAVLIVAVTTTALATSRARAATPELLAVDTTRTALVDALAAEVPSMLPPGAIDAGTALATAERIVRDSTFVEGARDAVAEAHQVWRRGGPLRLSIPSEVASPVAVAALRDVNLELARTLPSRPALAPVTVELPVTDPRVPVDLRRVGIVLGVVAVLALLGGVVLDPRTDRALRVAAGSCGGAALGLVALALVVPHLDLASSDLTAPATVAMIGVSRTPLLLAAAAAALLGAFAWASANQVAPLVDRRERRRTRRLAGPPPASSGAQASRRRGRAVRQQAIDAFFENEDGTVDDSTGSDVVELEERETPLVEHRGDGFDQAIAAVDADPRGGTTERPDAADADAGDDDEAQAAAADRREALERIDGARGRLRTHLPR